MKLSNINDFFVYFFWPAQIVIIGICLMYVFIKETFFNKNNRELTSKKVSFLFFQKNLELLISVCVFLCIILLYAFGFFSKSISWWEWVIISLFGLFILYKIFKRIFPSLEIFKWKNKKTEEKKGSAGSAYSFKNVFAVVVGILIFYFFIWPIAGKMKGWIISISNPKGTEYKVQVPPVSSLYKEAVNGDNVFESGSTTLYYQMNYYSDTFKGYNFIPKGADKVILRFRMYQNQTREWFTTFYADGRVEDDENHPPPYDTRGEILVSVHNADRYPVTVSIEKVVK